MKFSIVTSFYNETTDLIKEACDSVLSQTYDNFEWIITNDFSDDEDIVNIIKNLPFIDNRIKYVEQKQKKEIWWNPHTYATGDVVVMLDGDDIMLPKTLEVYNYFYNKYPDILAATTELVNYKDGNKDYFGSIYLNYENYNSHLDHCLDIKNNIDIPGHYRNTLFAHGYNRSWRNIVGLDFKKDLDNKLIINDFIQLTTLEEIGKLLHIPRVLYGYNTREVSISRQTDEWNDKNFRTEEINQSIIDRRKNKNIPGIKRIFEQIFVESNAFLSSKINYEKNHQTVLFITPNILTPLKKEQIKELYFDHTIFFNDYVDNVDYCVVQLNSPDQYDNFIDIYNNIKKYINISKEVMVQITYKNPFDINNILFSKIIDFLIPKHSLGWFDFDNVYSTIKIY